MLAISFYTAVSVYFYAIYTFLHFWSDEEVKLSLCETIFSAAMNSETQPTYLLL